MNGTRVCGQCGAEVSGYSAEGLCPKCMLLGGLDLNGDNEEASDKASPEAAKKTNLRLRYFGDYELLEEIARGGMGVVYKARQVSLNRLVAVKMILAGQLANAAALQRFLAEAESAANLHHPNIVAIYEVGEHDGQHYFSMEYVAGQNLTALVREKPLPAAQAARYVHLIAEAIQYAHERGTLHRDLKPSNVILDSFDQPRITDFGLAKQLVAQASPPANSGGVPAARSNADSGRGRPENPQARTPALHDLTLSGQVLGTPSFMPPEQATGKRNAVGPASDVYSLGAILYHLVTARPPFVAESMADTLRLVAEAEPVSPRLLNPGVPRDLETICLKCLEKIPAKRYVTAQALADELGSFLRDEPIQARPVGAPEKLWRWCRRKPVVTGLGATLLLVFATGLSGVLSQWRRAERNATNEAAQRQHTAQALINAEIQRTELLFANDRSADAMIYLARILRQHPTNIAVATRLGSALSHRNFCLPVLPFRHGAQVTWVRFSPDGRWLATASKDRTARIWNSFTGLPLTGPLQHEDEVLSIEFSRDGKRVITASRDNQARIWDAATGKLATPPLAHEGAVLYAEFGPDGTSAVTASEDQTARIWDAHTGQPLISPLTHNHKVVSAKFSRDGDWVTTACGSHARLWNAHSGKLTQSLSGGGDLQFAEFSPDADLVMSGGIGGQGLVWQASNGKRLAWHDHFLHALHCGHFSPDGLWVLTGSDDNTARIWEAQSEVLRTAPLRHDQFVQDAEFSPDGQRILTTSADRTARIWDAHTGRPLSEPLVHNASVQLGHFSPDGQRVVTVSEGSVAWIWDVRAEQPLILRFPHFFEVSQVHFSRDGKRIVTSSFDHTAHVWSAETGEPLSPLLRHRSELSDAQFSPDGKWVATASRNGRVQLWDATTGTPSGRGLEHANHRVNSIQFSRDGGRLVTTADDPMVRIWDVQSGTLLTPPIQHAGKVNLAEFSPDGNWVLSASEDGTAQLWDGRTGERLRSTFRHAKGVLIARFGPDGHQVATASKDRTARIWDASTGQALSPPLPHVEEVNDVSFSPDGKRLATVSGSAARIWDASTGKATSEPLKHGGHVNSVRWSPDSQRIVTASRDGSARVWDAQTGHMVAEPFRHKDSVGSAEFSPDGRWIVTASADRSAQLWEVPEAVTATPEWLPRLAEAVAGMRFNPANDIVTVSPAELFELRAQLTSSLATNAWTTWAKWFFAESSHRSISPSSTVLVPEYVDRLVGESEWGFDLDLFDRWRTAVKLSPTNATVLARLAFAISEQKFTENPKHAQESDWLSRYAVELDPANAGLWVRRAQVLDNNENASAALDWVEGALQRFPTRGDLWQMKGSLLEKTNRLEEVLRAYTRALNPAGVTRRVATKEQFLLNRSQLIKAVSRLVKSDDEFQHLVETAVVSPQSFNDAAGELSNGLPVGRNPKRAVLLARTAVEFSPGVWPFANTLGIAYYRAGQYREAAETMQAASELVGSMKGWDLLVLAMACHQLGLSDQAQEHFQQAERWLNAHWGEELFGEWLYQAAPFEKEAKQLLKIP